MKHFFVDTNVILDMLADREGYADAASAVFDAAGRGEIKLSVCALSYSNIFYILRKCIGSNQAVASLRELSRFVSILSVDDAVIRNSLYSDFTDYEDAIQYYSACQDSTIDGIIMRNGKDFSPSEIPVFAPWEV